MAATTISPVISKAEQESGYTEPNFIPFPEENAWSDLAKVVGGALKMFPPFYLQSIFGPISSWPPPHRELSEYTILDLWRLKRTLGFLADANIPAHSHLPNKWARTFLPPFINRLFWRPSGYFQQTDPFDSVTSFSHERWFFLNGILTNKPIAELNSQLISQMFQRPVTVIHNQTSSFLLDLFQCAVGKSFKIDPDLEIPQAMTEPDVKATIALLEAMKNPALDRVVLLCHSQGTIIAANVLRAISRALKALQKLKDNPECNDWANLEFIDRLALAHLTPDQFGLMDKSGFNAYAIKLLKKLEVYTFANCANTMTYIAKVNMPIEMGGGVTALPYIENFANQYDLVARLGVISPLREAGSSIIDIDGPLYLRTDIDAWGHLLNQHYLYAISDYLSAPQGSSRNPYQLEGDNADKTPRLYCYFRGDSPERIKSLDENLRRFPVALDMV
ncbi:hypothetical protein EUZ85_01620 [Hahella sp. KA22]|uniref:hypothetical protein n=1 Tax=Hahella sp. KA22 TaxID=1628392 RepID=UPI000FDF4D7C|nr:hypothetical protein [Hahella sp. KA22]AZZ95194.1 hypothetical protein ENC22_29910 [Hahella sp. KA22]QAY52839.1 hypothetical protein EUZ85_01620 [Hahella sp. KA22]